MKARSVCAAVLLSLLLAGGPGLAVHGATAPGITAGCDSPPGTVKVVGVQFNNVDANALRISISLPVEGSEDFPSSTTFFSLPDDFSRTHGFTQTVVPSSRPAGSYVVVATSYHTPSGQPLEGARTTIGLPCPAAQSTPTPTPTSSPSATPPQTQTNRQLACNPASATPGSIITAAGAGFPPAATVLLSWKPGINATPQVSTTADGAGTFQVRMLIFPHDGIGPRTLAATPDPKLADPPFQEVDAQCLVEPGSVQPRDFSWRR